MESRRVTIVQYDLTSSEDEKDSDQTYVYSPSKLSPLSASEFLFEPPAEGDQSDHSEQNSVLVLESDSASDDAGPCASASKRPRLSGSASSDSGIVAITTAAGPIYVASSSKSEEQDNEFSRLPLLSDDLEIMAASTAASASIYVSSSSESEEQDSGPADDHACQTLRQRTQKSSQAQPLVPRLTSPRHLNRTTKIPEP